MQFLNTVDFRSLTRCHAHSPVGLRGGYRNPHKNPKLNGKRPDEHLIELKSDRHADNAHTDSQQNSPCLQIRRPSITVEDRASKMDRKPDEQQQPWQSDKERQFEQDVVSAVLSYREMPGCKTRFRYRSIKHF